ncbi:hypothetical protein QQX98_002383 [Neonectria punicea]|uniref:Uncharacterized protein n=1 Tax=Neonectria punicea TaxID=979145 RepID=A0ABR1HJF2_9HYPO
MNKPTEPTNKRNTKINTSTDHASDHPMRPSNSPLAGHRVMPLKPKPPSPLDEQEATITGKVGATTHGQPRSRDVTEVRRSGTGAKGLTN